MKIGSLATLVAFIGCATWSTACSTDATSPGGPDAATGGEGGAGGKGAGGAAKGGSGGASGASGASGGAVSGGAAGSSGSGGGGRGGAGGVSGADSGAGGEPAETGTVTTPDASVEGGTIPDAGAPDGAPDCANSRCVTPYPQVLYPPQNPASEDKAMLGKLLFWDEQVGELGSMACGTCHRSIGGGSDPRTHDKNGVGVEIAHLAGPDGILDMNPSPTSDDIRGAAGVLACASTTTVSGTSPQVTTRKPPSYFDAMFAPRVFWDGRAGDCKPGDGAVGGCFYDPDALALNPNAKPLIAGAFDTPSGRVVGAALEQQSVGPPNNPGEMACADSTWARIEARLKAATPLAKAKAGLIPQDMKDFAAKYTTYPRMFAAVYGNTDKVSASDADDVVNSQRIAFAIATHERRLTSNQTPWDRWIAGDDAALTAQEIRGYAAFMGPGRCQFCHPPPLFTDMTFHNIGFHKPAWDPGRQAITKVDNNADIAKFKTPTLRNVGLREPFGLLHEGEGPGHDLNTVMTLYKQGGQRADPEIAPNIDPALLAVPLTAGDIADIIEFMRNGLTDPRVKNETTPFDRPHLSTE